MWRVRSARRVCGAVYLERSQKRQSLVLRAHPTAVGTCVAVGACGRATRRTHDLVTTHAHGSLAPGGHWLEVWVEDARDGDLGVHFSTGMGLKWTPLRTWKVQTLPSELIVGNCTARPRCGRLTGRSRRDHHCALHEGMKGTVVGVATGAGEDVAVGGARSQSA